MKYTLITFLTIFFLFTAQAQTDNQEWQQGLDIEKEYLPTIRDANKLNLSPDIQLPQTSPDTNKVDFSNYTLDCPISFDIQKPNSIQSYSLDKVDIKKGYLNLGISTSLNTDANWGYEPINSAKNQLHIFSNHKWSNSNIKYLQNSEQKNKMHINDNLFATNYTHYSKNKKFVADAQYIYSTFNYYGYRDTTFTEIKDPINKLFQIHGSIESNKKANLAYKINFAYGLFQQKTDTTYYEEHTAVDFDLNAFPDFMDKIGLKGIVFDSISSINPYSIFSDKHWQAHIGLEVNLNRGKNINLFIVPDIQFKWNPIKTTEFCLIVRGGIKDNCKYNTFFENRYLKPQQKLQNSKSPLEVTLTSNIQLHPNLLLYLSTGYQIIKNEHFYITDYYSDVLYMDVRVFETSCSLWYTYADIFNARIKGTYYQWYNIKWRENNIPTESNSLLSAWNRPSFIGNIEAGYRLQIVPLRFDLNYQHVMGRKNYINRTKETESMGDIYDLLFKAIYTVNNKLSVFVTANNLLFQKYDIWFGYPAQSFNIMGGVNFKL